MRATTDACGGRNVSAADRPQADLFGEDLIGPASSACVAGTGPGVNAPARRGRRRTAHDQRERPNGEPLQVAIDRLDEDP
ncbi:hypothetical protein LDC_2967, partial [sediment metagenome]